MLHRTSVRNGRCFSFVWSSRGSFFVSVFKEVRVYGRSYSGYYCRDWRRYN
nr:MAG TPA: hypothetical protein [Caudoviricetes sp.]